MHIHSFIAAIVTVAVASITVTQAQSYSMPPGGTLACQACVNANTASIKPCPGTEQLKSAADLKPEHLECMCKAIEKATNIWYKGCEDECTSEWIDQTKGVIDMSKQQLCKGVNTSSAGTSVVNSSKKAAVALGVAALAAHTLL